MLKDLFALFFLLIVSLKGFDFGCTTTEEDLENHFQEAVFFGSDKSIVPANDGEMQQHCDLIHKGLDGISQFVEGCITGFPHEVMKILVKSMRDHMQKRCDNPKDKAEFIQYVGCLIPKDQKMVTLNVCSEKHIKMISLALEMGDKGHIHGSCCASYFFKHCILDKIEQICSTGHRQFWEEIFDDVASEVVTFACEGLDSREKCAKDFNPEYFNQLQAIDSATDPSVWAHGHKTPIKFFLDMVKKYHAQRL